MPDQVTPPRIEFCPDFEVLSELVYSTADESKVREWLERHDRMVRVQELRDAEREMGEEWQRLPRTYLAQRADEIETSQQWAGSGASS